jgi:hypothetical protein
MARKTQTEYKQGDQVRITLPDGSTRTGEVYEVVPLRKRPGLFAVNVVVLEEGLHVAYGNRESWHPRDQTYVGIEQVPVRMMTLED